MSTWQRIKRVVDGPIGTTIAASIVGFETIGGRFVFGVYQQPIQAGMGWPRAVFSLALAIGNLLQGLASPAWASINETFHRPLVIFYIAAAMYVGGLFLFSAAPHVSQSGWVTGVGILTGVGSAGVGLPILLGEVGRLFPAHDPAALRKRSLVFGILPSLGQAGQFVLAPIARALISSVGWIESARILAYQTMIIFPVLILLRRKTPPPMETAKQNVVEKPATAADDEELSEEELSGEQSKSDGSETKRSDGPETAEPKPKPFVAPATVAGPQYVAIPEPPTAWLATKEAFTHVPILFISAAYFTCGWHIGFVSTSMVAWLQDKGMNPQSAAWCLSCLGIGSMFATFLSGFLPSVIKGLRVKWILAGVYWARAVFVLLLVLVPVTDAGHLTISVFLGFSWLATVPPTTSLTASILGTRWLGTIVGIEFAAHQVGGFLGTYLGAVEYDRTGGYTVCWIITIVLAAIAGTFVAFAGDRTLRRKEIDSFGDDYVKLGGNEDNLEGGKAEEARSG